MMLSMRTTRERLVLALAASVLAVAACGDDDSDDAAAATEAPPPVTAPTASTVTRTDATTGAATGTGGEDDAASFPVTIEHKYGSTTIEEQPERVVSVGFADQDAILALGVVPVGIRDWYGNQPNAVWPWAQDELGDAATEVLSASELNYEQIRALDPDVIVGLTSGMTEEEYGTLSQIAPTVPQSDEYIDYGVPWQVVQTTIGQALGKAAEAEQLVAETEALLAEIAAAHPDWEGKELAIAYEFDGQIGAYASSDGRPRLMSALGFVTPQEYDDLAGDLFFSTFSWEEVSRLDKDLLMWISSDEEIVESIKANPLREQLTASREGREIFLGQLEAGAFSFASVLSIPFLMDSLVPKIEAAMDADPATSVPD
jgi:iron complex transport system substrate-binding protein